MTSTSGDRPSDDAMALEGEPGIPDVSRPRGTRVAWKGILAIVLAAASLATVTGVSLYRSFHKPPTDEAESRRQAQRPAAAANEPRRLDLTPPRAAPDTPASAPAYVVPAIVPDPAVDVPVAPIGVRRTSDMPSPRTGGKAAAIPPEDAPVLLSLDRALPPSPDGAPASEGSPTSDTLEGARRNLQTYQKQLQGTLNRLLEAQNAPAPPALDAHAGNPPFSGPTLAKTAGALFGGQLQGGGTPRAAAARIADQSLTLPKGTAFTCVLKTRVISATSGLVGCQTQRNVFGNNGRVLLIERGSHLDGEYRIGSVRPGMVRIPVLWTRIRTPLGVTVDLDSPGTGPLGESGIDGHVDNRWSERIGAAMLLSVIDDSVKLVVQQQSASDSGDTIVLPSTTANTSKLAEKVLDSTISIPPLIYQNQGGIVGIYVARDVDFSSVYTLKSVPR